MDFTRLKREPGKSDPVDLASTVLDQQSVVEMHQESGEQTLRMIRLVGGQFQNKGDELMLRAVVQHYADLPQRTTLVTETSAGTFEQRAQLGLRQRLWDPNISLYGSIGYFFAKRYRDNIGLVTDEDIDGVLDFSGFAYGDQRGPRKARFMAKATARWKGQGKRIVFLPQAFGPFEDTRIRKAFSKVLESVDLLFARDRASYEYVVALSGESPHIKMAPDFTNLLNGKIPAYGETVRRQGCIVPNSKMITHTASAVRDNYLPLLSMCINEMLSRDLEPTILLHTQKKDDMKIAVSLQAAFGDLTNLVTETDPLFLKGILGNCALVVASRYHALVSALSQGVPCLGTGWSHKYQMLFEDHGCAENLLSVNESQEEVSRKFDRILSEPNRSELIERLREKDLQLTEKSLEMWREVDKVLNPPV